MTNGHANAANVGTVLVGASAWSARSLVHETTWYPRRSMRAADRMAHYAERFDLVEIDATARFPPTADLSRQWVERTPAGFTFDLQGWSLLTGAATMPESLWEDLHDEIRPEARDARRLYAQHLSADALVEAWRRFRHAVEPLHAAGRLGAVVLRYPWWLKPGLTARSLLEQARVHLPDLRLAVELPHRRWSEGAQCESTLSLLEELDLALVCVDTPDGPGLTAATSELAVVRLVGRNREYAPAYRYSSAELADWVPRLWSLAGTSEVHVIFANCHLDRAVVNATELSELLAETAR
ncbi:MAG: DUF72 domain-containing protein [Acidimicrobiales bacterium]